ncbi:hypothetical protein, partial [Vibrio alginolyticus]|uniref:hypothetical protein n=1 Tax=Vibrio alginolyticus TaxID=663 RepID=UPI001BD3BDEE|nr:DUF3265 domain-containing protein [Vibrio alginolyticus]
LRVIRNAWHFYYAFILVFKVVCGDFGNCVAHTLTGRYVFYQIYCFIKGRGRNDLEIKVKGSME